MSHLQYFDYPGFGERSKRELNYSQAVRIDNRIEVSGQGGWDSLTEEYPEDIAKEVDQAFDNVEHAIQQAGGKGWDQVYKICIYITVPMDDIAEPIIRNLHERSDWQEEQRTLDQPQSSFMTKLPLEIRRLIYEKALGEASIHVMTKGGALLARRCGLAECRCVVNTTIEEKRLDFVLPLLRTCRLIYSEAIEYLYTANSFSLATDIDEQPTLNYLSYYFLPQRLTQIRNLNIYWELDSFQYFLMTQLFDPVLDHWFESWNALSKMTGLRHLQITLDFRYGNWSDTYETLWKERGEELLEPIKRITAPRDFVITLPDHRCSTDIDVGDSKCILRLPNRPDEDVEDGTV
ncbi:Nn.00g001480.m01.CDS01 [Neocucurbitaria sp. VM-36]